MEDARKYKWQKGVSLLLSLMMVSLIVLLVMFVTSISTGQLRFAGSSTDSSRAFSAADAGIEYALSRINLGLPVGQDSSSCKCGSFAGAWCPSSPTLSSNAEYCVTADNPASPRKITAVGRTTDTKIRRSLEVLVPTFAAVNAFNMICETGVTSGVTSLNLNSYCISKAYTGATGVMGSSGTSCVTVKSPLIGQTVDGAGANVTVTGLIATNYYSVQCYK